MVYPYPGIHLVRHTRTVGGRYGPQFFQGHDPWLEFLLAQFPAHVMVIILWQRVARTTNYKVFDNAIHPNDPEACQSMA